jgi:sarcosine oxidase subunit alpha
MSVNGLFKRFIPAAFYYKTFFWPHWRWFEPAIRRAAGLGVAPPLPDPDAYEHRYDHCDVLVVGSGIAGLAAAESAAIAAPEARVLLVEADAVTGGGLLSSDEPIEGAAPLAWCEAALARLARLANVEIRTRTMAFGFYDHGLIGLSERVTDHLPLGERQGARQRLWKLRSGRVILATGAFERPIAFAGNDLPGVMLASAAQTYLRRYAALPGRRIALCTNNDGAYETALALHDTGVEIAAIVDSRAEPGNAAAHAEALGLRVIRGAAPIKAKGGRRVAALAIGALDDVRAAETLACDTVLTSDGWNPAVHLHSQSGGSLAYDDGLRAFLPAATAQTTSSVGAAAGIFDPDAIIAHAAAAGRGETSAFPPPAPVGPARCFADGDAAAQSAWLDFQNDVTVADVQLAARENFRSVEHLKRYTTLGMASDQGKTSNVSGIHVLSSLLDKPAPAIGTTKFRPPFDPVTIGSFAGRAVGEDLMPLARCAAHEAQMNAGAQMEPYGGWLRPACYLHADESDAQAIEREVLAVRRAVGLFEASPLGKIEVKGPDAAEFLQRIYVNAVKSLKVGRCRYGIMLNEHGIVHDDGVFARIGEDHFLVGTTSGHAAAIADTFEEWLQCEWPELQVMVENVTTHWAVMNLAGPKARTVLAAVGTDIDLSADAFPHMTYREGLVGGVPSRIERVSFTGELSYEVAVPWRYGASLWTAMMQAGQAHGITPFGVEALMVMRTEKGFLHVGSDTDGTTYPQDIGFGPAMAKKADDFIGRRSTMRPDAMRGDRRQLVGIEVTDGKGPLETGAHVLPADTSEPHASEGWITSSAFSPTLERPVAIGLVAGGVARLGQAVRVWDLGKWREARIVDPHFYDPRGERLDG